MVQDSVDRIRSKGGDVVFVSMPTCGQVKIIEEEYVPRSEYWDVFARQIKAHTFRSEEELQFLDFKCTDGSHLNYDDAIRFTHKLGSLLLDKALL